MVLSIIPHSEKPTELQQGEMTEKEQWLKKQQEVCEQGTATISNIVQDLNDKESI